MASYQAFVTPGAGSWQVPTGVTSIEVQGIGGGGGGGGADATGRFGAAGGGGGAFATTTISVTPGQTLYYSIGAVGTGA